MVSIDFQFITKYGTYSDALILPDDHGYSEEQLAAMKQTRLDNWITLIENPQTDEPTPDVVEPTPEG